MLMTSDRVGTQFRTLFTGRPESAHRVNVRVPSLSTSRSNLIQLTKSLIVIRETRV